ncbi:hypothetical protein HMPREF0322_00314 [Desulfitobacterium hafniense DP7]|uniref:Uncharacterized protein n=1 Tax=Desulfitobacterium hafniense DP7 TaxID=537010 RepID=G9XH91_DESHA|nr:hypothetical protein HMPREF0322_00314 [Desulfitobacterium hafniense DP7]
MSKNEGGMRLSIHNPNWYNGRDVIKSIENVIRRNYGISRDF